ncbi:Protein RnfH [Eoetvoesiella caeni]
MKTSSGAKAEAPLSIQVVYAQADEAWLKTLSVAPGTTVGQALSDSGFAQEFPACAAEASLAVGLYGQAAPATGYWPMATVSKSTGPWCSTRWNRAGGAPSIGRRS